MSSFVTSVDEMTAREYAVQTRHAIERKLADAPKDWDSIEILLQKVILQSIANARKKVDDRKNQDMTYWEAISLLRKDDSIKVSRREWDMFHAIADSWLGDGDRQLTFWVLHNWEGGPSGDGHPYEPF